MVEVGNTFRLAGGVFYEPGKLDGALVDLLADDFTSRDMCFIGTREALGSMGQRPASPAAAAIGAPLDYRRLRPLYPLSEDMEAVATSGVLLRKLLKEAAWTQGEKRLSSSWLMPELLGRFSDHMRRQGVVLLISSADSGRQHRSSRILLRHSAYPVQTHEFTPARISGT